MQSGPHALKEDLARSVPGPSRRHVFLVGLLPLEFQDGLADMGRTEATLSSDMFEDGLAGSRLGQGSYRVGKVPSKAGLSPAVLLLFGIG